MRKIIKHSESKAKVYRGIVAMDSSIYRAGEHFERLMTDCIEDLAFKASGGWTRVTSQGVRLIYVTESK